MTDLEPLPDYGEDRQAGWSRRSDRRAGEVNQAYGHDAADVLQRGDSYRGQRYPSQRSRGGPSHASTRGLGDSRFGGGSYHDESDNGGDGPGRSERHAASDRYENMRDVRDQNEDRRNDRDRYQNTGRHEDRRSSVDRYGRHDSRGRYDRLDEIVKPEKRDERNISADRARAEDRTQSDRYEDIRDITASGRGEDINDSRDRPAYRRDPKDSPARAGRREDEGSERGALHVSESETGPVLREQPAVVEEQTRKSVLQSLSEQEVAALYRRVLEEERNSLPEGFVLDEETGEVFDETGQTRVPTRRRQWAKMKHKTDPNKHLKLFVVNQHRDTSRFLEWRLAEIEAKSGDSHQREEPEDRRQTQPGPPADNQTDASDDRHRHTEQDTILAANGAAVVELVTEAPPSEGVSASGNGGRQQKGDKGKKKKQSGKDVIEQKNTKTEPEQLVLEDIESGSTAKPKATVKEKRTVPHDETKTPSNHENVPPIIEERGFCNKIYNLVMRCVAALFVVADVLFSVQLYYALEDSSINRTGSDFGISFDNYTDVGNKCGNEVTVTWGVFTFVGIVLALWTLAIYVTETLGDLLMTCCLRVSLPALDLWVKYVCEFLPKLGLCLYILAHCRCRTTELTGLTDPWSLALLLCVLTGWLRPTLRRLTVLRLPTLCERCCGCDKQRDRAAGLCAYCLGCGCLKNVFVGVARAACCLCTACKRVTAVCCSGSGCLRGLYNILDICNGIFHVIQLAGMIVFIVLMLTVKSSSNIDSCNVGNVTVKGTLSIRI